MGDINIGERLSFIQLIKNKGYQIEIPIIQRDYAQGRVEETEIREGFIDALKQYLDNNNPNQDLDFVYGSLSGNKFIPLDGQQRLTTLFLLHWYISLREEGRFGDLQEWLLADLNTKNPISRFSYRTRTSSKEFCDVLLKTKIDLKNLMPADVNDKGTDLKNSLSKTIRDNGAYFLSWENDPTIKSMLNMLDTIHLKFKSSKVEDYYDRLVRNDGPVITFLLLNLNEFNLSDDLYIKMNSRGIPLTTFENFKARLLQFMKLKMRFSENRKLKVNGEEKEVSIQEYFSFKIDTSWTNLIWSYVKNSDNKSVDNKLMNLMRFCFVSQYALSDYKLINLEYLLGTNVARKLEDYTDDISFNKYLSLECITEDSIILILDSLDYLKNGDHIIKQRINNEYQFYFNENDLFQKVLIRGLALPQYIQFYAYIKYLIRNENTDGIDQWMRVIHNLTENTRIDGAEEIAKAIKPVEALLPYSNDILDYLISSDDKIDFFHSSQVLEEKIKAHLINKSPEWKNEIEKAEKQANFKGQVAFLIEFSGVLAYYETNVNCEWTADEDILFLEKFVFYSSKADKVFDKNGNATIPDFLWERSVLSKGNYLIDTTAWRLNFLNKNTREYSWKRLLRLPAKGTNVTEENTWKIRRSFVKEVFDDSRFDSNNLEDSLKEICKSIPDDWRKYFIEAPGLIKYCKQGFMRFISDDDILLYNASQSNHKHLEMKAYKFYLENFKNSVFLPFINKWPFEAKGVDGKSCAVIDEWHYKPNNANYAMDIRYILKGNFEIRFFDRNVPQTYCTNILSILSKHEFTKTSSHHDDSYIRICSKDDLLKSINDLCNSFSQQL